MKTKEIEKGWVVASMEGTFILPYTFASTRTKAIEKFMSLWDKSRWSWRKHKRQGCRCVGAKQTTELE